MPSWFLNGTVLAKTYALFLLIAAVPAAGVILLFRRQMRAKTSPRWPALVAGNLLVLLMMVSGGFLVMETYYRFWHDKTDAMGLALVSQAWSARHYHTNALGLRDDIEYPRTIPPGLRRVTFVGDSFTAGYGLENVNDRFANILRPAHTNWEVHAVAKPGLDTSTEVETMHNLTVISGYQVDYVVLVYQINDIGELMPGWVEGYKRMISDRFYRSWLCQNSYSVNLFYLRWLLSRSAYMRKYYDEVELAYKGPLWETEKLGLLAFANMTRIRGGKLLVVTFPYMENPNRFRLVHEQLGDYWKSQGVPHLDLLPTFSQIPSSRLVVNAHDTHPNAYAHGLAARAIDAFLTHEFAEEEARRSDQASQPNHPGRP
jgi:lysophospholipase L1-like esterase